VDDAEAEKELRKEEAKFHDAHEIPEPNSPAYMMPYFNATQPAGHEHDKAKLDEDEKPFHARPAKYRVNYEKPSGLTWKNRYP